MCVYECLCTNIPGYPSALVNVAVGSACMCILYINVSINIEGKITTNFHMNLKKNNGVFFFSSVFLPKLKSDRFYLYIMMGLKGWRKV